MSSTICRCSTRMSRKVFVLFVGLWAIVFLLLPTDICPTAAASDELSYDILIKGGTVYDGTLRPPFIADIAVKGDRIADIGNLLNGKAKKIIYAKGFLSSRRGSLTSTNIPT